MEHILNSFLNHNQYQMFPNNSIFNSCTAASSFNFQPISLHNKQIKLAFQARPRNEAPRLHSTHANINCSPEQNNISMIGKKGQKICKTVFTIWIRSDPEEFILLFTLWFIYSRGASGRTVVPVSPSHCPQILSIYIRETAGIPVRMAKQKQTLKPQRAIRFKF